MQRSRRSWNTRAFSARKSCGPLSASTAAAWLIDEVWVELCDCTTVIARISSFGPAA